MAKPRKQKKRSQGKRQVETALPKRQYKRTNRLLYVFSGILLVVFGGGAALLGTGAPRGPVSTPTPVQQSSQAPSGAAAGDLTTTPAPATATPAPAESTSAPAQSTSAPAQSTSAPAQGTPAPAEATPAPAQSTPTP